MVAVPRNIVVNSTADNLTVDSKTTLREAIQMANDVYPSNDTITFDPSIFLGGEFSGLGGTVYTIRPIVQYKQFFPVNKRRNAIGYNLQGSFITGYNGVVAPPFERAYLGGDNDLRGFDIRTISPIAFLPST